MQRDMFAPRGMKVKQSTARELGSCQMGELARYLRQPAGLEPSVRKATTEPTLWCLP